MKTLFWTIISAILFLSLVSLILYSGVQEVVTEPLPEVVAAKITDLRTAVDEMEGSFVQLNEVTAVASAAAGIINNRNWFDKAEEIYAEITNIYNTRVTSLYNDLNSGSLPESPQKQINEFKARAETYIANEVYRDLLSAKSSGGQRVTDNDWLRVAQMYSNVTDKYDRNMGLKSLGDHLADNASLADRIYGMMDAPFVTALHTAQTSTNLDAASLTTGITDPYVKLQILVAAGSNELNDSIVSALVALVNGTEDAIDKAYFAARVLTGIKTIPDATMSTFLAAIGEDNPLLMASTKLDVVENSNISGSLANSYKSDAARLVNRIEQLYPREQIKARLLKLDSDKSAEEIIAELEEVETVFLKDGVLLSVAMKKTDEAEMNALVDAMHDQYCKLVVKLNYFNNAGLTGEAAVKYLEAMEGYVEGVRELEPLIQLTTAWGKIDPLRARQRLVGFGAAAKVDLAVELAKVVGNTEALLNLNDVYKEISASKMFEPQEKSMYLRKLAGAMSSFNRNRAGIFLTEAYNVITAQ